MLAGSLWLISGSTPFPGSWTLLPVVGALLLLLAGTNSSNMVTRALATRPLTAIGDRSYSIYLWHWPFIAFAAVLWPETSYAPLVAAALSLAPAFASYRWVEQPVRSFQGFATPRRRRRWSLPSFCPRCSSPWEWDRQQPASGRLATSRARSPSRTRATSARTRTSASFVTPSTPAPRRTFEQEL